jgi:hypothetical protein
VKIFDAAYSDFSQASANPADFNDGMLVKFRGE